MNDWTINFRRAQEEYGTQEDLARESGVPLRSISRYRSGTIPRLPHRARLEEVLGPLGDPDPPTREQIADLTTRVALLEGQVGMIIASLGELRGGVRPGPRDDVDDSGARSARDAAERGTSEPRRARARRARPGTPGQQ